MVILSLYGENTHRRKTDNTLYLQVRPVRLCFLNAAQTANSVYPYIICMKERNECDTVEINGSCDEGEEGRTIRDAFEEEKIEEEEREEEESRMS